MSVKATAKVAKSPVRIESSQTEMLMLRQRQINFGDTVSRLGNAIEASTASLYDLQTAAINAKGRQSVSLSKVFQNIKRPLRAEWETLMVFFKNCHAFGDDVAFLKESIATETPQDCLDFLQDMGEASAELLKTAERLLETINTPILLFNQQRGAFLDLFGKAKPNPQQRRLETNNADQMGDAPTPVSVPQRETKNADQVGDAPTPVRVPQDKAIESFVDGALASLYPNGVAVLLAAETRFHEMLALYGDIVTFWKTQQDEFLAGIRSKTGTTISRVNQIADSWAASQKALTLTIATISRSCDAIGVESKGAPRPTKVVHQPPTEPEISGLKPATQHAYSLFQAALAALKYLFRRPTTASASTLTASDMSASTASNDKNPPPRHPNSTSGSQTSPFPQVKK
jgi:hypothetical protein